MVAVTPGVSGAATLPVTITATSCAPQWNVPNSGIVTYVVTNQSEKAVDADLVTHPGSRIVGSIRIIGPKTTVPISLRLHRGSYRWVCLYDHAPTLVSRPKAVRGGVKAATATPSFLPTTPAEMAGPLAQFQAYVSAQISVLQGQIAALQADIAANNLAQAKVDWLSAHMTYASIGGTYGALGDLDSQIDGLPLGLTGGVNDPNFEGLHKIEYLLWSGATAATLAPAVQDLANRVNELQIFWPEAPETANLLSTRAHEILEDTQRDTLSGHDDLGSGTSLATTAADIEGEQELLTILKGVIVKRAPKLWATAQDQLTTLSNLVQATKMNGQWVPLSALSMMQREQLNAAMSGILETLSPIPDLLEIQQFADAQGT